MASTKEGHIEQALFLRVKSLSLSPATPIAWPNKSFTPPPSAGYLRVTHIPNINTRPFLESDAPHQRLGILQIDVFKPKNRGTAVATDAAGAIAAHFPADLEMKSGTVTVSVSKTPDVRQALPDDAHWMVPVIIRYESYC